MVLVHGNWRCHAMDHSITRAIIVKATNALIHVIVDFWSITLAFNDGISDFGVVSISCIYSWYCWFS